MVAVAIHVILNYFNISTFRLQYLIFQGIKRNCLIYLRVSYSQKQWANLLMVDTTWTLPTNRRTLETVGLTACCFSCCKHMLIAKYIHSFLTKHCLRLHFVNKCLLHCRLGASGFPPYDPAPHTSVELLRKKLRFKGCRSAMQITSDF